MRSINQRIIFRQNTNILSDGEIMNRNINHSDMTDVIRDMTYGLMDNYRRAILTCDLNKKLYNQPSWKHIYHALYWFDYWCCTPEKYIGAAFHCDNLHSLDIESDVIVTQEELLHYFEIVKAKTADYLKKLTEDKLNEIAKNCNGKSRFECILGQFRHVGFHLGNVNAMTIESTGKWPYVAAREGDYTQDLFE